MADNEFIIRIIVDARNKVAGAINSAISSIDGLDSASRKASAGVGRLDTKIQQLEGNVSKASAKLRSMNPTLDSIDRKLKKRSATISNVNRGLNTMDRRIDRVNTAFGSAVTLIGRLERRLNQLDRKMAAMGARTYEVDIEVDTNRSESKVNALITKLASATRGVYTARTDVEIGAAMAKAEALKRELERLGQGDIANKLAWELELENEARIEAELARLSRKREVKIEPDYDPSLFDRVLEQLDQVQRYGNDIGDRFRVSFIGLINIALQAAIIFAEPLLSSVTAVGGALVAVGGAAGFAGAGLAGMAVAIVGQVLPVLGLLVLAFSRVAAVIRVFQLGNRVQDASQRNAARSDDARRAALNRLANAHEAVNRAQRSLLRANESLRLSQDRLNEARREGIRTLEDLIFAERRASLSAEESEFSLAVAAATGTGSSGLFQSAQLDNESAQLAAVRQRADTRDALRGGIERLPEVMQAKRAVDAARDSVADAEQALRNANRQVDEAVFGLTRAENRIAAIEDQYQQALADLSRGELVLLDSVRRFAELFTNENSPLRRISDIIIVSFAYALDRVALILQDNDVLDAFRNLANAISDSIREVADFFNSPYMRQSLVFFSNEAARNLGPVTDIFVSLTRIFIALGRAASPALAIALNAVNEFLANVAAYATSGAGQTSLGEFFINALDPIEAFVRLGLAVLELFFALIGPGGAAEEGTKAVDSLTESIQGATDYVRRNGREIQRFFADSVQASSYLMRVVIAIGAALIRTFDPDTVKAFSEFLITVVIPIAETFVVVLGRMAEILLSIANSPVGGSLLRLTGYALAGMFVWTRFAQILSGIAAILARILRLGRLFSIGGGAGLLAGVLGGRGRGPRFNPAIAPIGSIGDRAGRTFGSRFFGGASGILKKAGWIGIGISAGQGIASGFKNRSVTAGIQDFFHSITFGLVESYDESVREIERRAIQNDTRIYRENAAGTGGARASISQLESRLRRFREENAQFARDLEEGFRLERGSMSDADFNHWERALARILSLRRQLQHGPRDIDQFLIDIRAFRREVPRDLRADVDYLIELATRERRRLQRVLETRARATNLGFQFGVSLQVGDNVRRDVDLFLRQYRRLPEGVRRLAVDQALIQAEGLRRQGRITQEQFRDIRERILRAQDTLTRRSAQKSLQLARQNASILSAFGNSIKISMESVVGDVNSVLRSFGFGGIRIPERISNKQAGKALGTGIGIIQGLLGNAQGGIIPRAAGAIGKIGERGKDTVIRALGRGEVVLNHWQQRAINSRMTGQDTVYSVLNRVKGYHAGGPDQPGLARGGAIGPLPSVDGSKPGFAVLMALFRKLFGDNIYVMSGLRPGSITTSGNVSNHASGNAIDISNPQIAGSTAASPPPRTNIDALYAYIARHIPAPPRRDFLWRTEIGGNHYNHIHLGMDDSVVATIEAARRFIARLPNARGLGGLFGADARNIRRIRVRGRGLAKVTEGALNRVIEAANRRINRAAERAAFSDPAGTIDGVPDEINVLPPGGGAVVGASEFGGPGDIGTGTTGYRGDNLATKPDSYAELSNNPGLGVNADFAALGGLPYNTKLRITNPSTGKSAFAYKRDVGAGGGSVNGVKRAIDLWYQFADAIGFSGLGLVKIRRMAQGGIARLANWGGWHAAGLDRIFNRATLLGVGENGAERVTVTPVAQSSSRYSQGPTVTTPERTYGNSNKETRRITDDVTRKSKEAAERAAADALKALREALDTFSREIKDQFLREISAVNPFRPFVDTLRAVNRFVRNISRLGNRNEPESLDRSVRLIDFLLNSDVSPIAALEEMMTERVSDRARRIQTAIYRLRIGRRGRIVARIVDLNETGGLDARENAEIQGLVRERRDIQALNRINSALIRRLRVAYRVASARDTSDRVQVDLDRYIKAREELQRLLENRRLNEDQRKDIRDRIREQDGLIRRFRELLRKSEASRQARQRAQRLLNDALRNRKRFDQSLADNTQSIVEGQVELNKTITQRVLDGFEYVRGAIDRMRRRAEATTGVGSGVAFIDREIATGRAEITALRRGIRRARRMGDTDLERTLRDQLAEARVAVAELYTQRLAAARDFVNKEAERREAGINRGFRVAEILGTAGDSRGRYDQLISSTQTQISQLRDVMNNARRTGRTALADEIQDQIADLDISIVELTANKLAATRDFINDEASRREAFIGRISFLGELFRQYGAEVNRINQLILSKQFDRNRLLGLLAEAESTGNQGLAEELRAQIHDLDNSVEELVVSRFDAVTNEINRRAQFDLGRNDFVQRLAALGINADQARTGNFNIARLGRTDFGATGNALRSRGDILRNQRAALLGQLAAVDPRNTGAIEDLTSQIDALDAEIVENTQAVRDNTDAAFAAATERRRDSSDFFLGINSAASSINTALEQLSGNIDTATQGTLLSGRNDLLIRRGQAERNDLANLINTYMPGGVDLSYLLNLRGNALAPFLAQLAGTALNPDVFDDAQLDAIKDLMNAILENEQSLIDNTNAIKELNGSVTQTFSSIAWRTFRQAIFTGSGGLLPQYNIPQVHSGGWVTKSGIFELEIGERVLDRDRAAAPGVNIDELNLNVTNPTKALDVPYIGQRLAWAIGAVGRR